MNKNILKYCILFITILFIFSCKKYLDKRPDLSTVSPVTLTDAQALLDYSTKMNRNVTPSSIEASADDYFLLSASYDSYSQNLQEAYIWKRIHYNYPNDWSACYQPVYVANYCLELTGKIKENDANKSLWKNVHGSALFYRSYYFFELLMTYTKAYDEATSKKDLGIPLRQTSDFNEPSVRSNLYDCYNLITSDLRTASGELPDLPAHVQRPSRCAAYALLARTFLLMNQFDSALKYANLSLSIKHDLIDYNMSPCPDCDITRSLTSTSAIFKKYNSETIFYTEMNGNITSHSPSRALIDTVLYASYTNDDLRKTAFFTTANGYHKFKGSYAQSNTFFTGITTAEMYLITAECYARVNDVNKAMEQLNMLLVNRISSGTFIPMMATDKTDALNKVLEERRKELIFRGLRWSDIKRYNEMGAAINLHRIIDGVIYTLAPNANYYALPLPDDIVRITGMEQNQL
jgi:starch-binding outer membrane protein, SusD/RagB family